MTTAVEDISTTKKRLKIEIPTDLIEKEYKESLDKVRSRAKLPGFRPGKAPVNLIEKRFGGEIKAELIDRLVPEYYSKALKEADLVPVTMPQFESSLDIKMSEPLVFSLTVEVRPHIGELKYEGLKVADVPVVVEESEISSTIGGMRDERAIFEVVDRGVKEDDLIVIDYVKFDPSGEKELSSAKDQVMNLGNRLAPKGILDEVLGRKKGDTVDIVLPAAEGGEGAGDRLKITIKEVKEKKLPPLDDDFAKDFGFDTLDALKEKAKEGILRAKQERAAGEQKGKLLESLVASHEFDVPESLLSHELEKLVTNEKLSRQRSRESGEVQQEVDDTKLAEEMRPKAVRNVKAGILVDMIGEKEGVTVTEEELRAKIGLLARKFQATPEAVVNLFVTKDGSLDNLKSSIRDEKVMDLVLSRAEIVKGAS